MELNLEIRPPLCINICVTTQMRPPRSKERPLCTGT